jgi:hypothetical protein
METRMMGHQPKDKVQQYTEGLFKLFEEVLGIPNNQVYMTFLELDNWASKGALNWDASMRP